MSRLPRAAWLVVVALLVACAIATGPASGATGSSVVGATVLSATNVDTTGCPSSTAGITDFGSIMPGSSTVTSADCLVGFGSSNDTSMLRLFQFDGTGNAMYRPTAGALDTTWGGSGTVTTNTGSGATIAYDVVQMDDGRVVVGGTSLTGGDWDIWVVRYQSNGSLDTTFDGDGIWQWNVPASSDNIAGIAVQPDGKILIAGGLPGVAAGFVVARLNSNGTFDNSFDTDGIASTTLGSGANGTARAIKLQPDGKILVAGDATNANADYAIARFTTAGALDTTWGGTGKVTTAIGTTIDQINDIAVQPDGKVVVAGQSNMPNQDDSLARYMPDGTLDTSFDGDGKATITQAGVSDYLQGVELQGDGKILVVGTSLTTPRVGQVIRLTTAGALDATWGTGGITNVTSDVNGTEFLASTFQADGKVVAAGFGYTAGWLQQGAVARLTTNGGLDSTFDQDGVLVVNGAGNLALQDVTTALDGRLMVTGEIASDFGTKRYRVEPVADYAGGTTDWTTGSSMFGACLRAVSGSGVVGTWTVDAACTASNGAWWNPIPATSAAAGAKVAASPTSGVANATASLRFGLKTASNQPPGQYVAKVTFEVLAPNA